MAAILTCSTTGGVRCAICRVMAMSGARHKAVASGSSASEPKAAKPDNITGIAPGNPMAEASIRRQLTASSRENAPGTLRMKGPMKKVAVASASGISRRAAKRVPVAQRIRPVRARCGGVSRGSGRMACPVICLAIWSIARARGSRIRTCWRKRAAAIWLTGSLAGARLVKLSIPGAVTVKPVVRRMPGRIRSTLWLMRPIRAQRRPGVRRFWEGCLFPGCPCRRASGWRQFRWPGRERGFRRSRARSGRDAQRSGRPRAWKERSRAIRSGRLRAAHGQAGRG